MKAQLKSSTISKKSNTGSKGMPESNKPNVGTTKIQEKKVDYSSMWKTIQKITQPVSFAALKKFYNIR